MGNGSQEGIKKTKLLLVEGKDELNFFEELFKYIGKENIVQVINLEGKDNFKKKIPAFMNRPDFNKVEVLAVILDADKSCENTFKSITGTLKNVNLQPPKRPGNFSEAKERPKVGVFIMPDNGGKGMLEDLCLKAIKEKDREGMECVNKFLECAKKLQNPPEVHKSAKAKVQAFLSIMPEVPNSVGRAAQQKCWDFDSEELRPLKDFLHRL